MTLKEITMITSTISGAGGSIAPNSVIHPLDAQDADVVQAVRAKTAPYKGALVGPAARSAYDPIFEAIPDAEGVLYAPGLMGGIEGVWCRPAAAKTGAVILYLHGGAYVLGTAQAYRHFAGQFAARTQLPVFVAHYRLAPEQPCPAALDDALAAYLGLLGAGYRQIIVVGDSAGGGLSLALLSHLQDGALSGGVKPVAAVVMSPWTDLALTGKSLEDKAAADPMLTRDMLAANAALYLNHQASTLPQASPLYANLHGLPPLQIHVGTSEILLDDSVRYADRAREAGVAVTMHTWQGMPHVFSSMAGTLKAADEALAIMALFIQSTLEGKTQP
jgi:acetyl esterase/lipase